MGQDCQGEQVVGVSDCTPPVSVRSHVPADCHGLLPGQFHKAGDDVYALLAVAVGNGVIELVPEDSLPNKITNGIVFDLALDRKSVV